MHSSDIHVPRLHVITETRPGHDPFPPVKAALAAGARLIQIRPEDHYTDREALTLAEEITELCRDSGATALVNDRVHIAQAVDANGVHLGDNDLPIDITRRLLGPKAIIGGTARDPHSARASRRAGADYLGVGPVFPTTTKTGLPDAIGLDRLADVCESVDIPVIAISGMTPDRARQCVEAGAHGVAVVGDIARATDPFGRTREFLAAVGEQIL